MKGRTSINLAKAPWFQTPAIATIFNLLDNEGGETAIVGGAVRGAIMQEPVGDIDFATTLTPDKCLARAKAAGLTAIPTGKEHGTVTFLIEGQHYEITTLRQDVKTDGRHAEVAFGTDWEEDAKRRDFTINALYLCRDGTVYDPLGKGVADISSRTIRFIGEASARIREDYLRLLRCYRFAALYGRQPLDDKTSSALINNREGLRQISGERIRAELLKLLAAPDPRPVIKIMAGHGVLPLLLATAPNTTRLFKFIEIERSLGQNPDPLLRLGVLALHQKGDIKRLAERLKLSRQQQNKIAALLRNSAFPSLMKGSGRDKQHLIMHYHLGKAAYLIALQAAWLSARRLADDQDLASFYTEAKGWPESVFPVKGEHLVKIGIEPGPRLGNELKRLEDIWLESGMALTRDELLANNTVQAGKRDTKI